MSQLNCKRTNNFEELQWSARILLQCGLSAAEKAHSIYESNYYIFIFHNFQGNQWNWIVGTLSNQVVPGRIPKISGTSWFWPIPRVTYAFKNLTSNRNMMGTLGSSAHYSKEGFILPRCMLTASKVLATSESERYGTQAWTMSRTPCVVGLKP